ncbi:class I SAM-dependent methyltransferase [Dermabacteraceae bacterium P13264]
MSHYFTSTPLSEGETSELRVELAGEPLVLRSAHGVFSQHGLDKATAILLDRTDLMMDLPDGAVVADVGCGWGPIALSLALSRRDITVWAVDVNERARQLTALNAQLAGVAERVRVCAPEEVPAELTVDAIFSNPPIRIGKEALHELLREWLPRLDTRGEAYLVVGKNLGADSLQRWISEHDGALARLACHRIDSAKGFRILRVYNR